MCAVMSNNGLMTESRFSTLLRPSLCYIHFHTQSPIYRIGQSRIMNHG